MLHYPVAKKEIPSASLRDFDNNLFTRHPSESGDLCKEEPRLAKLAEETEIITTANTVHARRMLDLHSREKDQVEGDTDILWHGPDKTEKDQSI
jgi:hypothetical protein